ncbi:TfoX/Sxy family protein [Niveibacterium terrae]|uniref:TfoX/Sxy family protein n=1 Tax=Niveibacterium terrae TaxID=3373598 RepID=UPI003A91BE7A
MQRSEHVDWLCERLDALGSIQPRRMFGSWGLYCDGIFFAIVADEVLYLKVDSVSRPDFEAAGLEAFSYSTKDGRQQSLSYFPMPEAALDDEREFLSWARRGLGAALRARKP